MFPLFRTLGRWLRAGRAHRRTLRLLALSFDPADPWDLADGDQQLRARIADPDFWARVARGEPFGAEDEIVAPIARLPRPDLSGANAVILQVLAHRPRPRR